MAVLDGIADVQDLVAFDWVFHNLVLFLELEIDGFTPYELSD